MFSYLYQKLSEFLNSVTQDCLLPLEFVLLHRKCHLQQILLFSLMHTLQPRSHTCTRIPARVHDMSTIVMLCLIQQRLDTWLGEAPGTSIQRLFLGPDDVLSIGVAVQVVFDLGPREWMQLLDPGNGGGIIPDFLAVLEKCYVYLTCAEYDALDFIMGLNISAFVRRIGNDPLEVGLAGELADRRAS